MKDGVHINPLPDIWTVVMCDDLPLSNQLGHFVKVVKVSQSIIQSPGLVTGFFVRFYSVSGSPLEITCPGSSSVYLYDLGKRLRAMFSHRQVDPGSAKILSIYGNEVDDGADEAQQPNGGYGIK